MAKRIDKLPGRKIIPRRSTIELEWLDGSVWEGQRGEDFDCSVKTFEARMRSAARSRGLRVAIRIIDEDTVKWQARQADAPE